MLSTEALLRISREVGASLPRVETTVTLLDGGATVPFISRYRKEATGNLDEVKVRDIDALRIYYQGLEQRRGSILATIEKQGKLSEDLKRKILATFNKNELEDLYFPYKPHRRTKASVALEKGLGPLADYIWDQTGSEPVEVFAAQFVTPALAETETAAVAATPVEAEAPPEIGTPEIAVPEDAVPDTVVIESFDILTGAVETVDSTAAMEAAIETVIAPPAEIVTAPPPEPAKDSSAKRVISVEDAIEGALQIIAERVAENPEFRMQLREQLFTEGLVKARAMPGKESEKTKYEMYYAFEETVSKIPSHRMLAIRRGSRENVLAYSIEGNGEKFITALLPQIIKSLESQFAPYLERAVRDSYERLLNPSIQNEVRSTLRERSEAEAIRVFEENLRSLLLAPPAGAIGVMGIDPGIRTGCKVAVVDETGKFLEHHLIRPMEPQQDLEGSEKTIVDLVQKHNVRGIVIGNGTGSREAEAFVRTVVQKNTLDVFVVVVNEAGASVYSASKRAREEFPELDVAVRGAVSIARRLQDPLAELVKIDPRSIGVGQYQHDVDQKKLKRSLAGSVESSVNRVGVDLNTASVDLLRYVSGINEKLALGIVAYREKNGAVRSRVQLREIEGFGDRTFEQAAGFLRIKDGENPLDRTAVHPESYPIVERMAAALGRPISELLENADGIQTIDFRAFEAESGKFTVADIREELLRPGRDPRDKFVAPKFREDVRNLEDLKEGMELEGAVTNVTNFGAFVDLGVHQDGLVHISELSHKYIQDARQAAKVGDVVKVKVISVDAKLKRISLSMKAVLPKPPRPPRRRKKAAPSVAAAAATPTGHGESETPVDVVTAPRPRLVGLPKPKDPNAPAPKPIRQTARPPVPKPSVEPRGATPKAPPTTEPKAPAPPRTMEEKIRQLQEKFGRVV